MRVSLNLVKKYINIPDNISYNQIAYDLTLRTVEVESVENTKDKFHDIVVGKIVSISNHPNADMLKICMTDIGLDKPVQIVCGGSNLYEGEYVVVSKPGAEVVWHGEGEPVVIKETKMRGEASYGMICGAEEVFLDSFFPASSEREIVDLKGIECKPGDNIADILELNDVILEIDNKSLTNRPDLWGHYGIARELSVIYDLPLKELDNTYKFDKNIDKYDVEIKDIDKCQRYIAIAIDNIEIKESPIWMKSILINCGLRPINAIVDITNYVMIAVGQPLHAFDKSHVEGNKIVVRNAKKGEKLQLLDDNEIELSDQDLVICDIKEPMALAGIRGGKKDSILPDTKDILLEIANFTASTIRKTGRRFDEKTDASIRYEKNIDTERVDLGMVLALNLISEIFPNNKIVSYGEQYPKKTERVKIDVSQEFLNIRLGKELSKDTIEKVLIKLGYDVNYKDNIYHVVAPVWRSTGDVSLKDDVLGDIARLLSYQSFQEKPLRIEIEKAVNQKNYLLERRIKEYLALRCGFNEMFSYPWADIKYINASQIENSKAVKLATPPSPDLVNLRVSLIPNLLQAISKNLRYYNSFKLFELAQVYENGEYHESIPEETLPIHKKYLTGCIVDKDAKKIFYELKGVLEQISDYCHMERLSFEKEVKPAWADINGFINIKLNNEIIGSMGLVSIKTMTDAKIKRTNVALFEINYDKFIPYDSRTNKFINIPEYPLAEKDISIIVDNSITWKDIEDAIKSKVKELEFIEEYRGSQIPEGKKSITLRFKVGIDNGTMTSEQINDEMNRIVKTLNKKFDALLRDE